MDGRISRPLGVWYESVEELDNDNNDDVPVSYPFLPAPRKWRPIFPLKQNDRSWDSPFTSPLRPVSYPPPSTTFSVLHTTTLPPCDILPRPAEEVDIPPGLDARASAPPLRIVIVNGKGSGRPQRFLFGKRRNSMVFALGHPFFGTKQMTVTHVGK